jgi:hypothetical protein
MVFGIGLVEWRSADHGPIRKLQARSSIAMNHLHVPRLRDGKRGQLSIV